MLILKRFFPSELTIFAVYLKQKRAITVFFFSPNIVFRILLPPQNLIFLTFLNDQLASYLVVTKYALLHDTLIAQTFFKVLFNRIFFQKNIGLKTIGVGYHFVISKESRYIYISVGLSHLLIHRLHYFTKVNILKKKKRLLVLNSICSDLLANECNFIRRLRPPDLYCGKGLRVFHELYKLKEGKKQIR